MYDPNLQSNDTWQKIWRKKHNLTRDSVELKVVMGLSPTNLLFIN